jgi:hypothetical protein
MQSSVISSVIFIVVDSDTGAKQKRYFYTINFILGKKTSLPCSVTRQGLGKRDDTISQINGGRCDNVLSGQGYCTSQRVVIYEYGAVTE